MRVANRASAAASPKAASATAVERLACGRGGRTGRDFASDEHLACSATLQPIKSASPGVGFIGPAEPELLDPRF